MKVRSPSPAQIRAQAAVMVRLRRRAGLADTRPRLVPARPAAPDETPLSLEELAYGHERGIFLLPDAGEASR